MSKRFSGKRIWITGAGSGIGRGIALEFDNQGADLILSGRKLEKLNETRDMLSRKDSCQIIQLDLADHDGIEKIYNENQAIIQDVDILVNNAGISQRSLIVDTDFSVYKRMIDVNYLGTIRLSLLMLKRFVERGSGHFAVVTSVAGKFGVPVRSGYSASKFALHGFFEALRAEHHDADIHVSMVVPGFIKTDISMNALTGDGTHQGTMDKGQLNGMPVDIMAKKVVTGISKKKAEILVGGFKETSMAVWVSRVFPSIFRRIIAKSEVR